MSQQPKPAPLSAPPPEPPPLDSAPSGAAPVADATAAPVSLSVFGHLRAFMLAMEDPATPVYVKAAFAVGLLYLVSPIDLIPEPLVVYFGLGVADDAAVLIALIRAVVTVPTEAHKRAAAALTR